MILSCCNDCRIQYNQMIIMTLALCCIVVILIIVQSEELQTTKPPKVLYKWSHQVDKVYFYQLNAKNWTYILNDRFLSFSIDSSEVYHGFRSPSLRDKRLIRMMSHLGGGYLRLGGTIADRIVFNPASRAWPNDYLPVDTGLCGYQNTNCLNATERAAQNTKHVSMSADDWTEINEFCLATGFKLLFDFNVLLRTSNDNNSWDPRNAELLLDFSFSQGYKVDWELGNEPNIFPSKYGVDLAPGRLAIDYTVLRQLLYRYALYKDSILVGPATTNPIKRKKTLDYLQTFLSHGADVNAVTWHFYNSGPNATVNDFLNPELYDKLKDCIEAVKGAIRESGLSPTTPSWIGETGSAYGGGVTNISDRFVASMLHLDKLGTSASRGVELVIRQSLYRGNYRLLDPDYMIPLPDYWVSVLFKKLVGKKVLNIAEIPGVVSSKKYIPLRLYAHCSTMPPYPVIYGINLNNETLGLTLFSNNSGDLFSLRGYPDLLSARVELNGEVLKLGLKQELPKLTPLTLDLREPVPVRSYSLFFLISYNNLTICNEST